MILSAADFDDVTIGGGTLNNNDTMTALVMTDGAGLVYVDANDDGQWNAATDMAFTVTGVTLTNGDFIN